ncbi:ABC transporter permease [Crocinitomix catalasitica]|uniref:ABC transporter permease n=1 Tax=Crocinitomix catalasitica TaxID=184607 RepID=UPI000488873A|nr:FtsX-like permease family protein [Crocinitomix catalasitica]
MILKIAWKNIIHQPLNSILCVILLLFGTGIISLLLSIQNQVTEKFGRDMQDIDLVVGAKGSPLQLVLSSVYHIDAPTGNIKMSAAEKIMNDPMIDEAIPLAYGDSHKGYRILGTTKSYIDKYNGTFAQGHLYTENMETVIGADIAKQLGLKIGDNFLGTHGEQHEGHIHKDQPYTVVGILSMTNTVLDDLILTNIESVWQVHDTHSHHNHHASDSLNAYKNKEITAILLKCKTKLAVLNIPRKINQQTNMQAVLPGLEINRLYYMMGIGTKTLKLIAGGIITMAGLSVFFALYGRLKERKYELALMRTVGYRLVDLFKLLLIEGILLAGIGYILGTILSRIGLYFINIKSQNEMNFEFDLGYQYEEIWLLLTTLLVGILASLIPAWRATRIDVASTLSER